MELVNVSDIKNPKTGKTWREENLEKVHNIPLGTLVEIDFDDSGLENPVKGLRLFVVSHDRDCDGTPLYGLSFHKNWSLDMYGPKLRFAAQSAKDSGYSEETLKVIE